MEQLMKKYTFNKILQFYGLHPESCTVNEFLRGHINDSFMVDVDGRCKFFLQRINHSVFTDPVGLINNLVQVNAVIKTYYQDSFNPYPDLILNRNRKYYYCDETGNYWRMTTFVPDSRSFNI